MATPRWEIMSRTGPEDQLQAIQLPSNNSAQFTAGNDWTVTRSKASDVSLYYKDEKEAQRFVDMVEGSDAASTVLRDLASTRHICSQPGFALELCKKTFRAHQAKQCTPAYVEVLKCQVKLARAVDTLCKPQFSALTTCLKGAGGNAANCVPQITAFDQCTEEF